MKKFLLSMLAFVAMAVNAQEVEFATLTFPDENSENNKISSYAIEWTAQIGDNSWTLNAFNNNSWNNNWTYVRCGSKKAATIATILTDNAYEAAINKVVISLTKADAEYLNSLTLQVLNGETVVATINPAGDVVVGDVVFNIPEPIANAKYLISFDLQLTKSNGVFEISKVTYYKADTATAINTVATSQSTGVMYNLAGQRVNNAKGIVIVDGKKIVK